MINEVFTHVRQPAGRKHRVGDDFSCKDWLMELHEMQESAREVRARFATFEHDRYGRSWTPAEIMLGFVGDVGDLSKLVQGKSGVRSTPDLDTKVAHELADCLWSVFTLADCYDVDLGHAFSSTMEALNGWLDEQETSTET